MRPHILSESASGHRPSFTRPGLWSGILAAFVQSFPVDLLGRKLCLVLALWVIYLPSVAAVIDFVLIIKKSSFAKKECVKGTAQDSTGRYTLTLKNPKFE